MCGAKLHFHSYVIINQSYSHIDWVGFESIVTNTKLYIMLLIRIKNK